MRLKGMAVFVGILSSMLSTSKASQFRVLGPLYKAKERNHQEKAARKLNKALSHVIYVRVKRHRTRLVSLTAFASRCPHSSRPSFLLHSVLPTPLLLSLLPLERRLRVQIFLQVHTKLFPYWRQITQIFAVLASVLDFGFDAYGLYPSLAEF